MDNSKKIKLEENCFDNEDVAEITIDKYIQYEENKEEEVDAVLGGSSEDKCSRSDGYVKRQAVYACADCCDLKNEPAGICLACSYHCHDGHNLYELYTKRNFRCDCGNEKFSSECKLDDDKGSNEDNQYNHNFQGLYCTCNRPFPDEEMDLDDDEAIMIQCVICEDWFHNIHLGQNKIPNKEHSEMICEKCTSHCKFLGRYRPISVNNSNGDGMLGALGAASNGSFNCGLYNSEYWAEKTLVKEEACSSSNNSDATGPKNGKLLKRKYNERSHFPNVSFGGASFWPDNWRSYLCKCKDCLEMYKNLKVKFLIDEQDTISWYESKAKDGPNVREEEAANYLNKMDHTVKLDVIAGYNSMKNGLMDYLKKFAESGETVTKKDISEFFEGLKKNKRPSHNFY